MTDDDLRELIRLDDAANESMAKGLFGEASIPRLGLAHTQWFRPLCNELLAARATLSAIRDLCRDRDNVYAEKVLSIIDHTAKGT